MISEFYQLRRTAIKDIAAYLGFLVGFIGSAPFAWGLLASQLDAGKFARGLWYFFGIVTTAGIFAGTAGLGVGIAAGLLWEQLHRYRRSTKSVVVPVTDETAGSSEPALRARADSIRGEPRLQLITDAAVPLPNIAGRRVVSVTFTTNSIELDFGGIRARAPGTMTIVTGSSRHVYPDPGSRDAVCGVLDARVDRLRGVAGDRIEILLDNGTALLLPRGKAWAADGPPRRINAP